jgi:ribosomal protein S18 acetylase RimI-like enzyme
LVAEHEDGEVIGYVHLAQADALPSHQHVLQIRGIAVAPSQQGSGVARELLDSAVARARERGGQKIGLRVLASNEAARGLYASAGFTVEGVLREEFLQEGKYVDDILMALTI